MVPALRYCPLMFCEMNKLSQEDGRHRTGAPNFDEINFADPDMYVDLRECARIHDGS